METGVTNPESPTPALPPKADPVGDFIWGVLGLIVSPIAGGVSAMLGSYAGFAATAAMGLKKFVAFGTPGGVTDDGLLILPGVVCGGLLGPAVLGIILVGGLHSAKGIAIKFGLFAGLLTAMYLLDPNHWFQQGIACVVAGWAGLFGGFLTAWGLATVRRTVRKA